jgi:hypothetical protein
MSDYKTNLRAEFDYRTNLRAECEEALRNDRSLIFILIMFIIGIILSCTLFFLNYFEWYHSILCIIIDIIAYKYMNRYQVRRCVKKYYNKKRGTNGRNT